VVLQDRAAGDDRAGDLDLVEGQDVDQGGRRPGGVGQALGQAGADVALGLDDQAHEDRVEQDLDLGRRGLALGLAGVAHVHDAGEQALAIVRLAAAGQGQKLRGLGGLAHQPPRNPSLTKTELGGV
jgi:hypothetical protein